MKLAKSILYGATMLALAIGSATAESILLESSDGATAMYDVDEDRDGRTDRTLMLEQSDSLA